jgi:hypothetical protein
MPTLYFVQATVQREKHTRKSLGDSSTNLEQNGGIKERKAISKANEP